VQTPPPSRRSFGRPSRWALAACVGWACLNPQPDTNPLEHDDVVFGTGGSGPVGGGMGGGAGTGFFGSSGSGGGAGSAGSGSLPVVDAGDGGSPDLTEGEPDGGVADAGAEVGDAGP
jgi:hypothetical protein